MPSFIQNIIKQINMQLKLLLYLYCLLSIVFNFTRGINVWKKYNKLRKKINKILNKEEGTEFLLNINEYEYPKANETLRKIHKESWQEYYECLTKTYNEIGSEKIMYPIAFEALEGTLVMLKCQICISPIEVYISDNIKWYFNSTDNNETNKSLEESDNLFISPEDRTLMIYNIKSQQAGQYWCKLGDTLSISYYVSIDTDIEKIKTVYPITARNMPQATAKKIIPEYNLNIHTIWTKWSPCSKYNIVGKKVRYGYCIISSNEHVIKKNILKGKKQLQNYKRQTGEDKTNQINQNETLETITQNQIMNENVNNKINMVLHVFRNKVPCKNKYLSKTILDILNIKDRKTEMMVHYCKVKCPESIIFEVRDKKGNVLESANNSAGIYSMVQGMPPVLPQVIRTTLYKQYDKKAILICPGNVNTDIPINWKVNNQILYPSLIKDQSEGRIYINTQMHIIFKSLKFEDTNIYSCWQKNKIVGVIRLNVTGEIELQTNYSVIMFGAILIIIVFMVVFFRVFQGRKRFTIH